MEFPNEILVKIMKYNVDSTITLAPVCKDLHAEYKKYTLVLATKYKKIVEGTHIPFYLPEWMFDTRNLTLSQLKMANDTLSHFEGRTLFRQLKYFTHYGTHNHATVILHHKIIENHFHRLSESDKNKLSAECHVGFLEFIKKDENECITHEHTKFIHRLLTSGVFDTRNNIPLKVEILVHLENIIPILWEEMHETMIKWKYLAYSHAITEDNTCRMYRALRAFDENEKLVCNRYDEKYITRIATKTKMHLRKFIYPSPFEDRILIKRGSFIQKFITKDFYVPTSEFTA